jgi:capsular exopolysaccharide synthesis family protein
MRTKKKQKYLKNKRELIVKLFSKSSISEQYRTIRTNIQFASVDHDIRSIMITSAGPEEGKSTTAANLAVVFAQQGKRVLLVDADLRKPTIHYSFHTMNTFGLTNILTKKMNLEDVVRTTDEQNLFLLMSGPIPPNPSELLASKAMKEVMNQIYKEFEIIIFDTPPILAVTDAQILANISDGIILVISSGKTEIDKALKAKEMLTAASGNLLGVVLNNKKMKKNNRYNAYYGEG